VFTTWWWPATVLEHLASLIVVLCVFAGIGITLVGVIGRVTAGLNLVWENEAGVVMLSVLAFVGASIGYRRRQFAVLNWLDRYLSVAGRRRLDNARDGVTFLLAVVLTPICWDFAHGQLDVANPYLGVSQFWVFLPVPVGTALIGLFALERMAVRRAWPVVEAAAVVVAAVIAVLLRYAVLPGAGVTAIAIAVTVLAVVMLAAGVPLPFAFAAAALAYSYLAHNPLLFAASALTDSTSNFVLVAIPFFLLVGFLMSEGRLSDRLGRAFSVLLSRVPGGLLHVIVISMFLFSGVSGSKIGDMAAVGKSARRMAEKEGYSVAEAMSVVCAGAAMGDTIPPSIGLIVLASVSTLSVSALFVGGILPAVVTALVLFAIIAVLNRKRRTSAENRVTGRARLRIIGSALPFLVVPLIIVIGIGGGYATPSEASAIAVAVSVVLICGIYRSLSLRSFWHVSVDSSVIAGVVLFIVATASLFARSLTLAQVPQEIARFAGNGGFGGYWGFLIGSSVVLIIMGMVMEGLPAMLVFAPILIPVATELGINPLQYGIVILMAIGIGANSPPIGIGVFVVAQIGDVPISDVSRRMRPYVLTLYVGLLIVIAAPAVVSWLPTAFGVK
jgi:tripartite ATP-independent transporter DctM subunit